MHKAFLLLIFLFCAVLSVPSQAAGFLFIQSLPVFLQDSSLVGVFTQGTDPIFLEKRAQKSLQKVLTDFLTPTSKYASLLSAPVSKNLRQDIHDFYQRRNWRFVWHHASVVSHTDALGDVLRDSAQEGLDPKAYPIPVLWQILSFSKHKETVFTYAYRFLPPEFLALSEITLSASFVKYATHAQVGRLDPKKVFPSFSDTPRGSSPWEILDSLVHSHDPKATLLSYHPQHEAYQLLRAHLARVRLIPPTEERIDPLLPTGNHLLKKGMRHPHVRLLRQRLHVLDTEEKADFFDESLHAAVMSFQRENALWTDGIVGTQTRALLNKTARRNLEADIIANMERWRWLPESLGEAYVFVNIPAFKLDLIQSGRSLHQTRIVVGKRQNQTPIFSDEIEYLVVNPYWHVPRSILRKEMLPKIRKEPRRFLRQHGYEVLSSGRVIRPEAINWRRSTLKNIRIRQIPGEKNALGRIKFIFPNRHNVYLHDTPMKTLFSKPVRAFSHGCVRIDEPIKFASALLSIKDTHISENIESYFGKKEKYIPLKTKIPIHITYFTSVVSDGALFTFPDIYGHHEKTLKLLENGEL